MGVRMFAEKVWDKMLDLFGPEPQKPTPAPRLSLYGVPVKVDNSAGINIYAQSNEARPNGTTLKTTIQPVFSGVHDEIAVALTQPQPAPVAHPVAEPKKGIPMSSILVTIETDIEKFFKGTATEAEKFGHAFETLFKKAPNALQTVQNFTTAAAAIIVPAVEIVDPVLEPEVAGALSIVQTGLAGLQAAATNATSGQSLLDNLQNFATSTPALLSSLQIKNPALQTSVTRIESLIVNEAKVLIPAVQNWVAQIKAKQQQTAPAGA